MALAFSSPFLSSEEACLLLGNPVFLLGKRHFGTIPPLLLHFSLGLLLIDWILSDSSMSFLIHLLHHVWSHVVLDVLRELFLIRILILLHQVAHVVCHILTHDVLPVHLCIELLAFRVIARESFGTMGDRQASIHSSLQGAKNFIASCSSGKTCIQIASEGTRLTVNAFHIVFISIHLHLAFIDLVHAKPIQKPAGQQQASAIGCSIVCQANFHTVFWKFMCICCTDDHIPFYTGICNLADDVSVRYTNYHPVFRCVVLIFVLDHQSFPCIVVSFTLSPPSKSHLVSFKVGLILDNFHEPHPAEQRPATAAPRRPAESAALGGKKLFFTF